MNDVMAAQMGLQFVLEDKQHCAPQQCCPAQSRRHTCPRRKLSAKQKQHNTWSFEFCLGVELLVMIPLEGGAIQQLISS